MRLSHFLASGIAGPILLCGSAAAQDALPDPATIETPDVSGGKAELDSEGNAKYFFFHKDGIAFETAVGDVSECVSYGAPPAAVRLPAFVILEETAPRRMPEPQLTPQFGLVGLAIASIIMPSLNRRIYQGNMRICMGYKNYTRYATTKDAFIALNEGDDSRLSILMQAKIAAGPMPQTERLDP